MGMTNEKFVDVDGIRTRYFEKGEGDSLVLIHGGNFGHNLTASSALTWFLNFDGLAQWFHVYAVDKLGQGGTDIPKHDEDYTMAAAVQHIHGFLQAMGLRDVHLLGHSRGAYLVARLTLEHPELVKTCIIVDSNTLAPGIGRNETVHANPPEPRLSKESQRWAMEKYAFSHDHITDEYAEALAQIAAQAQYRVALEKMETEGLRTNLFLPSLAEQKEETLGWIKEGRLKTPTLVIWSYNDPTATIGQGQELFSLIAGSAPRSQMHVFNQSGHQPHQEHPEDFNRVVRDFALGS